MSAQPVSSAVQPPQQHAVNSRQELQVARQQQAGQLRENENTEAAAKQRQEHESRPQEVGRGQVIDVIG